MAIGTKSSAPDAYSDPRSVLEADWKSVVMEIERENLAPMNVYIHNIDLEIGAF